MLSIENKIRLKFIEMNAATFTNRFEEISMELLYLLGYKSGSKSNLTENEFLKLYEELKENESARHYITGWLDGKFDGQL